MAIISLPPNQFVTLNAASVANCYKCKTGIHSVKKSCLIITNLTKG